jgi:hypothetical protein
MKNFSYNKAWGMLVAFILFFLILVGIYLVDIHLLKVDVVLYSAIGCGVLATAATSILLVTFSFFRRFNGFEKTLLTLIFALVSYILAISIPTIIDRSLSIYMLEKLADTPNGILKKEFTELVIHEYLENYNAVNIRLIEQLKSGTILIDENGRIYLTSDGQKIVKFSHFFKSYFLSKNRMTTP